MVHNESCMCDKCIILRVKKEVSERGPNNLASDYIRRRGGDSFPQTLPPVERPEEPIKRKRGWVKGA